MLRNALGHVAVMSSGIFCFSCSDPVPSPAQGAVSVSLAPKENCAEKPHSIQVPGGSQPVNASGNPRRATDGVDSAKVSCSVVQTDKGFQFSGNIIGNLENVLLTASVPLSAGDRVDFDGTASVASGGVDYTGVRYAPDENKTQCKFRVAPSPQEVETAASNGVPPPNYQVAPGVIYGAFYCDDILDVNGGRNHHCKLNDGYFVFKDCSQ